MQPKLSDLMTRYLEQQANAHAAGLATFDPTLEVTPFEAGPVQPVDPRPAWEEAIAVLPYFQKLEGKKLEAPPHWPNLVAAHEPVVALAFCVGNYPQLMRDLHLVLHKTRLTDLRPQPGRAVAAPALTEWAAEVAAQKRCPQMLLAAGALRLAKQYDDAEAYLTKHESAVPAEWRGAWANEAAALTWHRGRPGEALALWQAQTPSAPVLFNRGMASLFLGKLAEARAPLAEAVKQLPEADGWHHLGRMYLTLAQ
jgi:tetratricopeptide (TPR) repeat protein